MAESRKSTEKVAENRKKDKNPVEILTEIEATEAIHLL